MKWDVDGTCRLNLWEGDAPPTDEDLYLINAILKHQEIEAITLAVAITGFVSDEMESCEWTDEDVRRHAIAWADGYTGVNQLRKLWLDACDAHKAAMEAAK